LFHGLRLRRGCAAGHRRVGGARSDGGSRRRARVHVRPLAKMLAFADVLSRSGHQRPCAHRDGEGKKDEKAERREGTMAPSAPARRLDAPPRAAELRARHGGGADRDGGLVVVAHARAGGNARCPRQSTLTAASGRSPRAAGEVALDTSEHASHLIALYTRRGYRFVEHVRWDTVNYRSVVLSKALGEVG